jgi:uncharacterized protein (DUF2342 family)
MLIGMIKKLKTIDDVFEKLSELATRVEVGTKMDKLATHMNAKIDTLATRDEMNARMDASVGGLAIMVEKGFAETTQDLSALTERIEVIETIIKGHDKEFINIHGDFNMVIQELKAIRNRLDRREKCDNSIDIINLDLRVRKLEKRTKL